MVTYQFFINVYFERSSIGKRLNIRGYHQEYNDERYGRIVFHLVIKLRRSPQSGNVRPKGLPHHNEHHREELHGRHQSARVTGPIRRRVVLPVYAIPLSRELALEDLPQTEEVGLHASGGTELDERTVKIFRIYVGLCLFC